jgi:hypothetical protein
MASRETTRSLCRRWCGWVHNDPQGRPAGQLASSEWNRENEALLRAPREPPRDGIESLTPRCPWSWQSGPPRHRFAVAGPGAARGPAPAQSTLWVMGGRVVALAIHAAAGPPGPPRQRGSAVRVGGAFVRPRRSAVGIAGVESRPPASSTTLSRPEQDKDDGHDLH